MIWHKDLNLFLKRFVIWHYDLICDLPITGKNIQLIFCLFEVRAVQTYMNTDEILFNHPSFLKLLQVGRVPQETQ